MNALRHLSSPDNPSFRRVKKLLASARERRRAQRAVLDGWHLLEVFVARYGLPEQVLLSEAALATQAARAWLAGPGARCTHVLATRLFERLAPVETPTGVLAIVPIPVAQTSAASFGIALEDIQDPGNLGSILRSAAAAGVEAAWLSKGCADAWSPRCLRAGMGAHFHLALHERADLPEVLANFPGVSVATRPDAPLSLFEASLAGPLLFVFGNEGAGLSAACLQRATRAVRIPMPGGMESLNVAAAAAVCLFERVRQTQAGALLSSRHEK